MLFFFKKMIHLFGGQVVPPMLFFFGHLFLSEHMDSCSQPHPVFPLRVPHLFYFGSFNLIKNGLGVPYLSKLSGWVVGRVVWRWGWIITSKEAQRKDLYSKVGSRSERLIILTPPPPQHTHPHPSLCCLFLKCIWARKQTRLESSKASVPKFFSLSAYPRNNFPLSRDKIAK